MGYEFIDLSGDAGVRASGGTLKEAFQEAARGMYALITDLEGVREERRIGVKVKSHSLEGLLVGWLNELVFHLDARGFIGRRAEITELDESGFSLEAAVWGEDIDMSRHEGRVMIKAATYHGLKLYHNVGGWTAEVMFDL